MAALSSTRSTNKPRSSRRNRSGKRHLAGVALPKRPYWIPGERAVTEVLRGESARVRHLFVREGKQPSREIEELAAAAEVTVSQYRREQLEGIVEPSVARGVMALAEPPKMFECEDLVATAGDGRSLLLALDGVQDPQNLGALLRSAEFFGCEGVFWPRDRAAPLGPTVVRASAGASERVRMCSTVNLARAFETCKQAGYWIIGTVAEPTAPSLQHAIAQGLPDKLVVVMGSEERGVRRLTRERCDFLVTIPQKGSVASLNVSAAAAVVLSAIAWRPE